MDRKFARPFYKSAAWKKCRDSYMQTQNYICERCGDIATLCHHKKYITPSNINDPNITLNWGNLEALCQTCHNREHHGNGNYDICASGLTFDGKGNLIKVRSPRP